MVIVRRCLLHSPSLPLSIPTRVQHKALFLPVVDRESLGVSFTSSSIFLPFARCQLSYFPWTCQEAGLVNRRSLCLHGVFPGNSTLSFLTRILHSLDRSCALRAFADVQAPSDARQNRVSARQSSP